MKERTRKNLMNVGKVEFVIVIIFILLLDLLKPIETNEINVFAACFVIVWIIAGMITYIVSDQLYDMEKKEKQEKESKEFVRNNIPIERWIQVNPKEKADDFLLEIIDIADIYAYREDEGSAVKIYLGFHGEEKKRFYIRVKKKRFTEYYEIK